jgi:CDP-diacylglycerol--glycerol-3-phosphate 3-phosphatidyltransferase
VLERRVRKRVDVIVTPFGRGLARIGIKPIHLTLTGLLVTLTGSVLLGRGWIEIGALAILGGSALDGLDGAVARVSGTASARGALVDSVSDRLGETAMFAACAFWLTSNVSPTGGDPALALLCVLSLGAALITSYLRAKADVGGVDGGGGIMGRSERVILFSAGFLTGQVTFMLWAMAILTWLTVFQRYGKTWRQLGPQQGQ